MLLFLVVCFVYLIFKFMYWRDVMKNVFVVVCVVVFVMIVMGVYV